MQFLSRLISRMDDVLDLIQDTAESFQLYDIRHLSPEACELADLLHECCLRLQRAVHLLSNMEQSAQTLDPRRARSGVRFPQWIP